MLRRRLFGLSSSIKRFSSSSSKTPSGTKTHDDSHTHTPHGIMGPGAKTGTIGSEFDQTVGVERLEMLSKLAGKPLFSSSQVLCHPKGEGVKGTLSDPVLVETLAREEDGMEVKERIVGCSGVPRGSHEIGYFWVRGGVERCPECGQAFKLKSILH